MHDPRPRPRELTVRRRWRLSPWLVLLGLALVAVLAVLRLREASLAPDGVPAGLEGRGAGR